MLRRALPVLLVALSCSAQAADEGFVDLVKGEEIQQFELAKLGPDSLSIKDGEVRMTGKPNGFFATKESYKNYVLEFDWRFERPADLKSDAAFRGNGGLLIHVAEPLKVWPKSVEVQVASEDAGHIFAIAGGKFQGKKDAEAQKRSKRPIGEWNHQVVTCKDGTITCSLNGEKIDEGKGADPASGRIGWQSEGSPMRLKNIRIKKLP